MDRKKILYIGIIIIAAVAGITAFALNNTSSNFTQYDNVRVSQSVLSQFKAIAMNTTLAGAVGSGGDTSFPTLLNSSPLVSNGKPELLYVGGDFCPYCAITRWSLIIALMRFGNFTKLHYMTSSTASFEPYRGTPTFTFYNSSYSSGIVNFTEVEIAINVYNASIGNYPPLQNMTQFEKNTMTKYDSNGGIPFIDFGNYSVQNGAVTSPGVIQNQNWSVTISQLSNPNTPSSQNIIGTANVFTAQICEIIHNNADICSKPFIQNIEKQV